jgi:hypothetical protein
MPKIQLKKLFRLAETFFHIAQVVEKAPLYFLTILLSKSFCILIVGIKADVCMNKILLL